MSSNGSNKQTVLLFRFDDLRPRPVGRLPKLHKAGIKDVRDFLFVKPADIAKQSKISINLIKKWRDQVLKAIEDQGIDLPSEDRSMDGMTPTERAFNLGLRMAEGERLTVTEVAGLYSMSYSGAYRLLSRVSAVAPLIRETGGIWRVMTKEERGTGSDNQGRGESVRSRWL